MTTFTSSDREEAEKRQRIMNDLQNKDQMELPLDWEETSSAWPFKEEDILEEHEVPDFKTEE
jgi:hypothetical protein